MNAHEAAGHLEAILDLASAGLYVDRVRIVGRGREAPCDIFLSNGEVMRFEKLTEIVAGAALPAELAACAGIAVEISQKRRVKVVALLRAVADRQEAEDVATLACDWGAEFLAGAPMVEIDMLDQHERWEAFGKLRHTDPWGEASARAAHFSRHMPVLVDRAGSRFVRTGWFCSYVRHLDSTVSQRQVIGRMLRVGWQRRGSEGRIKATSPSVAESFALKFLIAPAGWEDIGDDADSDGQVHASTHTRAHACAHKTSSTCVHLDPEDGDADAPESSASIDDPANPAGDDAGGQVHGKRRAA